MTTPTDDPKVKELLEAAREFRDKTRLELLSSGTPDLTAHINRLMRAVRAFDPPKPKQYTIGSWDALTAAQQDEWRETVNEQFGMPSNSGKFVYETVCNLLATAKD